MDIIEKIKTTMNRETEEVKIEEPLGLEWLEKNTIDNDIVTGTEELKESDIMTPATEWIIEEPTDVNGSLEEEEEEEEVVEDEYDFDINYYDTENLLKFYRLETDEYLKSVILKVIRQYEAVNKKLKEAMELFVKDQDLK